MTSPTHSSSNATFTHGRERVLLWTLAMIQFVVIVDFLVIIPLEPKYVELLSINTRQFGIIVAAYGISAGVSGLAAGFFLDLFDRKKALLWLLFGFAAGTLLCAFADTYAMLVAARAVAGAFGGVVGAVILAIVGDVIPIERRGAAMGTVMSSFSVASILGVPLGIEVAARYNWHVPFLSLAILSAVVLVAAAIVTPPLRKHLEHVHEDHPIARTWAVMTHPDHQMAFVFMAILTCAGFIVFPFVPAFMRYNIGFSERDLKWIYLFGGLCTLYSMNWVGRWADRSGKLRVFRWVTLSTAVPLLLVTNLPRVPVVVAILVTTLLFICMSARMVPAMAMMTAVVEARYRGGFMSINSAVQQLAMGAASLISGKIVVESADHSLNRFWVNGIVAIVCAYSCIYLAKYLKAPEKTEKTEEPIVMEAI